MPETPNVGLVTRFVLENPWPLGGLLVLAAVVMGVIAVRDEQFGRLRAAAIPLVIGVAIFVTERLVTTAGEHARDVTTGFVDAVVAEDLVGSVGRLAPNATLHLGAANNAGQDRDTIVDRLSRLAARYDLVSNRITNLDTFTTGGDTAVVHLSCSTEADGGFGHAVPSRWTLEIERGEDDVFRIRRLTCLSVAGSAPPGRW